MQCMTILHLIVHSAINSIRLNTPQFTTSITTHINHTMFTLNIHLLSLWGHWNTEIPRSLLSM